MCGDKAVPLRYFHALVMKEREMKQSVRIAVWKGKLDWSFVPLSYHSIRFWA